MKNKLIIFVGICLFFSAPCFADTIIGALPYNLTNGTTADASQVMADFNTIVSGANTNAAANGVNTSITQLAGLTTPLTPSQGGTGTSTLFTQGSVIFAGSSGYAQNNSELFWDNSNYRLGIGTDAPTSSLEVIGATTLNTATASTPSAGDSSDNIVTTQFLSSALIPKITVYLSGSGTYDTPAGAYYIKVRMVGGGGGGSQQGAGTSGGNGGATTFGTSLLTANGGSGASSNTNGLGGTGGTVSVVSPAIDINSFPGAGGGTGAGWNLTGSFVSPGGAGASSPMGGGGIGSGGNAVGYGSGGGGASAGSAAAQSGGGGGAGGYVEAIIESPSSTYSYNVGSGGTAGSGAGAGHGGKIIIEGY